MHATGSILGSTCIQRPISSPLLVLNLSQREGIDSSQQNVRSQGGFSTDWREHPEMCYWRHYIRNIIYEILRTRVHHQQAQGSYLTADILEFELLKHAASEEEYINEDTLLRRVQTQLNDMGRTKGSQQVDNSTSYKTVPLHFPDTGMDELSHMISLGRRNMAATTNSNGFSFPQKHADELDMDLNNNGSCWGSVQKNEPWDCHSAAMGKSLRSESSNLMFPQHVSRVNSEVYNLFPGLNSNSILGDIRQCQPQPMHLQQSFEQFIQPNELCGKSTTFQTGSSFLDRDENCDQMSGKKALKRPWLDSCCDSKGMLRPDKILKMMSDFDVSSINDTISDQWTTKTSQPYSLEEALPELQQQRETSISSMYSDVANCHVERFAYPRPDSMNICGQILEESDLRSHDPRDSSNLMETDNRLNSSMHTLWCDPIAADIEDIRGKTGVSEQLENPMHDSMPISETVNNVIDEMLPQTFKSDTIHYKVLEAGHMSEEPEPTIDSMGIDDTFGKAFKSGTVHPKGLEDCHISEDSDHENHVPANSNNSKDTKVSLSSSMRSLSHVHIAADVEDSDPENHVPANGNNSKDTEINFSPGMCSLSDVHIAAAVEDISGRIGFNLARINAENKVSEEKVDEKKETKFSKMTANIVSLTDFFTSNQIREHIRSLRKQPVQSMPGEEAGIAVNTCQLCAMQKLYYAPVPIYCSCCNKPIKLNTDYYHKKAEESDSQNFFCTVCYKKSRGEHITFNAISVQKELLDRKTNDEVFEEGWVECKKCERWQHQICALFNGKRDLVICADYICLICRLKEIEEGIHISLPKTAIFGAKDLPKTMLGDHIEKRLFKRLMQERVDRAKVEGNKNLDEVLPADSLSVKVVLSADKQLEVKKQFLNIFPEQNYPAEFPYTSKVILLFQQIDGADVCLFAMYVQEFGSECGNPNKRCVYISYLDSVKYFRPERETIRGEALRTLVYHEILIGYLDFCKKRGFTTCYIWACPPTKGEDYILYCHPDTQKTPKNDKLRHWYLSMLRKAAAENIVLGLSNIYDHFFVPTGKWDSKVTASRLPYFDGDYWSSRAMGLAGDIDKDSGYEKTLKKLVKNKRALKALGHVNPSIETAKDILVMQRLGKEILPYKEDFIIVHLQHTCVHCQEVIVSGKRWFCTECKIFQECERCHTADSHTSTSGEKHTLCQVLVEDVPLDTKENDIILDNQLFENRHNFLSFCQKNQLQFDTLRRAKHSTMMILYHLKYSSICSICGCERNEFQHSCRCECCPDISACKERGAECHAQELSQTHSTSLSTSGNEESKLKSTCHEQKLSQTHSKSLSVSGKEESKLKSTGQEHKLSQTSTSLSVSAGNGEPKKKSTLAPTQVKKLLEVLQHASQCNNSNETQPCPYTYCLKMKMLLSHARECITRASGGCRPCYKALMLLDAHSKTCEVSECRIPCCMNLKMRRESRDRAAVVKSKQRTF